MNERTILLPLLWLLFSGAAQAQIYRCDTPDGPAFSDAPCGEAAEVVVLDDDTTGISFGPPAHVRSYLEEKREERAEERAAAREARARAPVPAQPIIIERPGPYPGFWGGYPRPRPPRPPRPTPPIEPPTTPGPGGDILRPREER